jgi:thioredoxin 1
MTSFTSIFFHAQPKLRDLPLNSNNSSLLLRPYFDLAYTMAEIPVLTSRAAYLKAVSYEGISVLEGTATWCSQCKAIAPEVQKMVQEFPDVKFYTYDVEETPDIAQELGVSRMPTFSLFRDGDSKLNRN